MKTFALAHALAIVATFVAAECAAAQTMTGYSPSNADKQKAAEAAAIARPDPSKAQAHSKSLSDGPHVAGTQGQARTPVGGQEMLRGILIPVAVAALALPAFAADHAPRPATAYQAPRMADGRPDLVATAQWQGRMTVLFPRPKKRISKASIAILIFLTMAALFFCVPLYILITTSLKDMDQIREGAIFSWPRTPTLDAWDYAWNFCKETDL